MFQHSNLSKSDPYHSNRNILEYSKNVSTLSIQENAFYFNRKFLFMLHLVEKGKKKARRI